MNNKPIPIYGKGENIRDWLFVNYHCRALDMVFHSGIAGETYNVGGHNEWNNLELVHKICEILDQKVGKGPDGKYSNLIEFVTDRPGHDLRYAIDPSKIEAELNWQNTQNFDRELGITIDWYIKRYNN